MKKYNIGDIVFVAEYEYKNGGMGQNHIFVIVDDGQAIDINYFGFLLSSRIEKASYPFNVMINKNHENNLNKDSIVKCDDLIELTEDKIKFKLGSVNEAELMNFINTYEKYLETIE